MYRQSFAFVAVAALVLCPAANTAHGQKPGKKSADVVKMQASTGKADAEGKQVITVKLTIDKGWHLYGNPVGIDDFASSQTELTLTGAGKPEIINIDYPKGKTIKDALIGNYAVYEGEVTIKATIKRAAGSTGEIEASVKLQACSDSTCLPPSTVKTNVEVK